MKFIGVIPARFESTRFPGKPLIDIKGKPMIQRVYEQASKALKEVVVATDDKRIVEAVKAFGGNVVMTSSGHESGTDRCAEAVKRYSGERKILFDVVINIQGDEPFIEPAQIEALKHCFDNAATDIATLAYPTRDAGLILDPNKVKVVTTTNGRALYFSRNPIPYVRGVEPKQWGESCEYKIHLGVYGYRSAVLERITTFGQGNLEKNESLEQLRWLENGLYIMTGVTNHQSIGVDTPKDLEKILKDEALLKRLY